MAMFLKVLQMKSLKKIRLSKASYYSGMFCKYKSNMKKTWQLINEVVRPGGGNTADSCKIVSNGVELSTAEACNNFNDFFVDIGPNIADTLRPSAETFHSLLPGNYLESFFFNDISSNEVKNIIMGLNDKRCPTECLPIKILKYISDIVSPILSKIINKSVSDGIFPDSLKIARVVPIFKDGDVSSVGNYRPISVLPILSKIFEKAMYLRLYRYLSRKSILSDEQYGFRDGRCTVNAVLDLCRYLYKELDAGRYVLTTFLDFRKAFDCVQHDILLSKLWHYGIRGNCHEWLKSYLSNRKQFVSISGTTSNMRNIRCGVPQGSILGPLLFLTFINDITKCSTVFKFSLYADDCTLSYAFHKDHVNIVSSEVNAALKLVINWINCNKLCVNVNKTGYMVFSYRGNIEVGDVFVDNVKLNRLTSVKFLGINVDSHLTFKDHVNFISTKISKGIGLLYKLNKTLPLSALKSVYFALVHSHLVYGIEVYYNTANAYRKKLFLAQKKAIRAINSLGYVDHTNDSFFHNRILKLNDIHQLHTCIYMFKALYFGFDDCMLYSVKSHSDTHQYATRNNSNLLIPFFTRSKSQNSIDYVAVQYWNSLNTHLKQRSSVNRFKYKLREFLLNNYE